MAIVPLAKRPIGYFVHHHGNGHARRCIAIARELAPQPIVVFCADPKLLADLPENATVVPIPNFHGKAARSQSLHDQPACVALDCAPLGVSAIRGASGAIAQWLMENDPVLFVVDVSAELALLGRICSVPTVKIRMHGDRDDLAHNAAYSACVGILAPFDERLEQDSWPEKYRQRTFYAGGLIDTSKPIPDRHEARQALSLPDNQQIFVVVSGHGGVGTPLAPITLGARAFPDALWLVIGKTVRYGHETDFANVRDVGWIDNVAEYLAAADVVIASPGDTLTHEIARVGRPLICVPEWCYYGEQANKAEVLARENLAVHKAVWPSSFKEWIEAIDDAMKLDLDEQTRLVDDHAARRAADYLSGLVGDLWSDCDADESNADRMQAPLTGGALTRKSSERQLKAVE